MKNNYNNATNKKPRTITSHLKSLNTHKMNHSI